MDPAPLLFAPLASRAFGERVAACLGAPLAPLEEREYEGLREEGLIPEDKAA